jgi:drug/metabolite transporter (DMT)-like permease
MMSSVLVTGETIHPWKIEALLFVIGGLFINFMGSRFAKKRM